MRRLLPIALLCALPAFAQERQPLPAVPPPPPGMEAFDAAIEPEIVIKQSERETREEYRIKGKLYMIKVTPVIGKPYYLIDKQGNGQFEQMEVGGAHTKPPLWVIHSW